MKTSSKDFVVKVEMAAWFYIRRAAVLVKKPLCCHIVTRLNHVRKRTDTVRDQMNSICPLLIFYLGWWNNNMKGSSIFNWKSAAAAWWFKRELRALLFVRGKSSKMSRKINSQKPTKEKCKFFQAKCSNYTYVFLGTYIIHICHSTGLLQHTIEFTLNYLSE